MLDKVFAAISMLGVVAFMGVVIIGVWEPDLWIVTILILGIAILFVWEEIKAGGSHLENEPEHENKDDYPASRPPDSPFLGPGADFL